MRALLIVPLVVPLFSTGCAGRLTPDEVRALLDDPKGTVSAATLPTITRDLFVADRAGSVENIANVLKTEQSAGSDESAGDEGAVEAVGDTWCIGSLVASIASFDGCQSGDSCKAELTIDSCVLRVGDPGIDEDANGSIRFQLDNEVDDDVATTALALEFRGWESSRSDETLNAIDGLISLDTVIDEGENRAEVVVAADVDARVRNKERGFLDDGYVEQVHLMAGARFLAESTDTSASGSLEVLALLDEDGAREESVVIRMNAEGRALDAEEATASAALEIVGENGTFRCSWSATSEEGDRDGVRVASAGECTDENGEVFSFEGEAVSRR
jgi:hypothetical protein